MAKVFNPKTGLYEEQKTTSLPELSPMSPAGKTSLNLMVDPNTGQLISQPGTISGITPSPKLTYTPATTPTSTAAPATTPAVLAAGQTLKAATPVSKPGGVQPVLTGETPTAQPQTTPFALSQLMTALQEKVTTNNALMDTRNLMLKSLYDQPLTPEERAKMDPAMLKAIDSGDRNLIDMNLRLVSDQIQGRTGTLDQSVQYLTQAYQKTIDDANTLKQQSIDNVLRFVTAYGSNAPEAMKSLYGQTYLDQLKGMGIDIQSMADIQTLSEFKTEAQYGIAGGTEAISIPGNTLAAQNNNPGNLKYVGQSGSTLGAGGFAKFDTPEAGYQALVDQIGLDASRGYTLESFITKYAPPSENDTATYINQAEQALGVPRTSSLSELNADDIAKFISQKESGTIFQPIQTDVQVNGAMLASGELAPSLLPGFGQAKAKALAEAKRLDPSYNPTTAELNYQAAKRWVTTMNSSQMIRFNGLATSVVNTINEVNTLADQMSLSGITPINAAELMVLINTAGNTPQGQLATRYVTAVNTLKEEFANLAQGGYAPTEAAWSLANSQINSNYGVDQLKSSLTEIQRLINFRVNAIQSQLPITAPTGATGNVTDTDPMGLGL